MKKNLTELVFILDRSGSMGGLEQDTIGGFNAMLTRQKEQEGEANVTTILFDHEVDHCSSALPLPDRCRCDPHHGDGFVARGRVCRDPHHRRHFCADG